MAHVVAQVVDENNVPVQTKETMLTFGITGNAKMLGVDNGDANVITSYSIHYTKLYEVFHRILLITRIIMPKQIPNGILPIRNMPICMAYL